MTDLWFQNVRKVARIQNIRNLAEISEIRSKCQIIGQSMKMSEIQSKNVEKLTKLRKCQKFGPKMSEN